MRNWDVISVRVSFAVKDDVENFNEVLDGGWEPFAVTDCNGVLTYHFRKPYVNPNPVYPAKFGIK